MGITVQEAMKLKGLSRAKLLAGEKGLTREIKRVSVIECPESPDLFMDGDFFITAFFALKDDADSQLNIVKALVEAKCSGLCVIDMYLEDLPEIVKNFAEKANFPLMLLPNNVPYAEIITNVMDAIIQSKDDIINEMRIDTLLQPGKGIKEIIDIARKINPNFREKVIAAFYKNTKYSFKDNLRFFKNRFDIPSHWSLLNYKNGTLILMSFGNESEKGISLHLKDFIKMAEDVAISYKLGISSLHESLSEINLCIKEAILACNAVEVIGDKNTVLYKNLGIYRLLMLLIDEPELKNYMEEILNPIKEYDRKYSTRLLETMISYVDNDGDISKTAKALFLHVNTIRYRIEKIKEILDMQHLAGSFYEQISIAVKIYKLCK